MVTWLAFSWGFVKYMAVQPPWTLPAPIGAFLTTGGDWRAVILCLVNILISTAIYYPFMRMYDRDQLKKENCENISEWLQFMVGENMNGGVAVSDIETSIFTIITSAGEARTLLYEAVDKARAGKISESKQCMIAADKQLKSAHDVQTELITRDLNGSLPMSLLLVHAQDQLMTTMSEQSLIGQMIGLIQDISEKDGN